MEKFRNELNSKEKLARALAGPEKEVTHFVMNGKSADELLKDEKAAKFNQSVADLEEKFDNYKEMLNAVGKKMSEDIEHIEIMPVNSYVLVSPFKTNPFQKIKREGAIITDLGGLTPTYKSQETGDIEEEEQFVHVGTVVETGTDCHFVQPGDIVMYNKPSEVQVPFYKFGFVVVAEQRLLAVVGQNLSDRKKDIVSKNKD